MIEAAYDLLRTTPPIKRWRLPEADDVVFRVVRDDFCGSFRYDEKGVPTMSISAKRVGKLQTLIEVVAHEMVHMKEDSEGLSRADVQHSARFKRLAAQVCRHHGFDEKTF